MSGKVSPMNRTEAITARIGRWSLWLLLALAIPYAGLVFYSGLVWGVLVVGEPLNKLWWFVAVGLPIWVWLAMVGRRAYPRHSLLIALVPWLMLAGLVTWGLLYGVLMDREAEAVLTQTGP